jgi:hypothetical protein
MQTANKLKSMWSTGLVAKLSNSNTLKLDSQFLGNVDRSLFESREFLMTATAGLRRQALEALMNKFEMKSIYGPDTLRVMEEIGWVSRNKAEYAELQVDPHFPHSMSRIDIN